ncbi:hypothetical protein [Ruegeria profundi]|uniref:Uncharacterized protein n=1 Tax=Ruegeria profundi TaxID=1685378 RepID=A0A0X3TWC9_9RHOB|nr:hypothetical protein [Ruegeria profundi]KUJ77680.1 hypothetical protein AVO44_15205 [Ruegeria profundi]
MILGTFFFLLSLVALAPVLFVAISGYKGPILQKTELFISDHDSTLLSLGTLFLVSSLALLSSHISNKSAERREWYSRRIQASLQMSEFRLKWVEELRSELAQLQTEMSVYNKEASDFKELTLRFRKVFLMLNFEEKNTKDLNQSFQRYVQSLRDADKDKKNACLKEFHRISNRILKEEWKRIKVELEQAQVLEL